MSKNDLIDDIDYSSLHPAETTPAPTKARIEDRQFKKEKPKAEAKPIDMEALKGQAAQAKESAGMPELSPSSLDYVIPGLGILGGLYMLHQNLKSRELPSIPKQDMRAVAPVAPAAPVQAPLPAGLSPQEFDALSPEDKALVVRGGQNSIAKQTAQQELAQQVSKLQTELASIPQAANPVPVPQQQAAMAQAPAPVVQPPVVQPANVVSTGPTPEAADAPIEKAAEVKKVVEPPPKGMKPQYTKKKGEIGPGGYNWFASQVGHEEAPARWEEQYGKRNVPYEQVQQEYQATRYPPTPKTVEGKSGGAFGKPEYIPEHIRGSSNLKGLAGLAGTAGLLMAATSPESQAAMTRASNAIKDIGISPEAILRGKGDELGRMGNAYVTAGNPNYLRELQSQIDVENNPERKKVLLREFQKIGGSGAGRGIAPPSAYLR